jgi:hypothetical protein
MARTVTTRTVLYHFITHLCSSTKGCLVSALCTASAPATHEGFSTPYGGYLPYVTVSRRYAGEERIELGLEVVSSGTERVVREYVDGGDERFLLIGSRPEENNDREQ